jgi:DNA-binding Lrp family transcriptional regulator
LAKLTEEQVEAIRAEREGAKTPLRDLAEKYGVHRKTIGRIVRRASWVDTP